MDIAENNNYAEEQLDTVATSKSAIKNNSTIESKVAQQDYAVFLQIYLCVVVASNLCLLFFEGHGSDLGFWQNWIGQLATKGYNDFNGNYPPVFIHWLYLLGQLYNVLGIPVENDLFLKFLSQLPILISHLLLTTIVFTLLKKYAQNSAHFHYAMLLTVLNPAILFNGPIWGQIDIMPVIPVLLAILFSFHSRLGYLTLPFYCIALLTKFQMIAFAPVFGIIFFRNIKMHLVGAGLSILVFLLVFLPSILSGSFVQAFKLAYIDVLHQYGVTTLNASNIWILLTGNGVPDNTLLFGIGPDSPFAIPFTAKYFGMITFSLVCAVVFLQGLYKLNSKQTFISSRREISTTLFYAMVCATAFFTLLPAMHERYLLPAVIISLVHYAVTPNRIIYPLGLSFISAFNVAMILGLRTFTVWPIISWVLMGLFIYCILELLHGKKGIKHAKGMVFKLATIKHVSLWVSLISVFYVGYFLHQRSIVHTYSLQPNEILLTYMTPISARQGYGSLQVNKSVDGNTLSVGGKRYRYGIGTHTNSTIEYQLPENSSKFSFIAGIDDEVGSANVQFTVLGDRKVLWRSSTQYGAEKDLPVISLDIKNVKRLMLIASSKGSINGGHADWINPIITLAEPIHDN